MLKAALAAAGQDGPTRGRILLSLAHAEAEQGNIAAGLELFDLAAGLLEDQTYVHGQRGLLLARTGHSTEAIPELDKAIAGLREAKDPVELSRALLNRGYALIGCGGIRQAKEDLIECERLARRHGLSSVAIKARQNLGFLDLLRGNLPLALRQLAEAAAECARDLPSYLPAIAVDRARVLLAAGLVQDADRELDSAIQAFRRHRLSEDHAEAELARAGAALLAGRYDQAYRLATAARQRFRRRHNHSWGELAALSQLRADFARGAAPLPLARQGAQLATRLAAMGLVPDSQIASLLVARCYVRAGRPEAAGHAAGQVAAPGPADSLDLRMLWHLAHAEMAAARQDHKSRADHLRAGLARLHQHRSLLGSFDLQTGIAIHGHELAAAGLASALEGGQPEQIFDWAELARAQAFRLTPVRPPPDPEAADALEELRALRYALRQAELRREPLERLRARRADLERTVTERAWCWIGNGSSLPIATLPAVLGRLTDSAMVFYLRSHGRLSALVLAGGAAEVVPLGEYARMVEQLRRLHVDLDTLARRALPPVLQGVVLGSCRHDARQLADLLLHPLLDRIAGRSLVIIPTGELFTVPWLHLSALKGRPVIVTPSATAWMSAREPPRNPPADTTPPPVLVSGPDIEHGEREIEAIAAVLPHAVRLSGPAATPAATLSALSAAPLAHIAAHGHHEPGNALFSSLDLTGGPLMGYDLQQLPQPPRHVVLSACELGLSNVRSGDEILGMVAALLASGTRAVIASVCRVTDQAVPEMMTAYHRFLDRGSEPAHALAAAAEASNQASFVCFGS